MNNFYQAKKEAYFISTDPSLLNIEVIHHFLAFETHWAKDVPVSIVEKSIAGSLCFGVYHQQHR
ncbi:hypothetical protein SAMN05421788_1011350 [Filimonas lacunae]|uniref:Uncharacterized protein n=1 Tax=Filimonas lacunae TaxID=477680 RepID=A0A173MR00_9BACT|nr:hypothetical protein [Filimonas lacunae]BAV09917.1 hypothetical protein FLA_5970 [Filimonas lacunae]SIS81014.1 hypothetical protein SAMN05421788_1011350 [Filimonas lacunae]